MSRAKRRRQKYKTIQKTGFINAVSESSSVHNTYYPRLQSLAPIKEHSSSALKARRRVENSLEVHVEEGINVSLLKFVNTRETLLIFQLTPDEKLTENEECKLRRGQSCLASSVIHQGKNQQKYVIFRETCK